MVSAGQRGVQVTLSPEDLRSYVEGSVCLFKQRLALYYNRRRTSGQGILTAGSVRGSGYWAEGGVIWREKALIRDSTDGLGRSYAPYSHFHGDRAVLFAGMGRCTQATTQENAAHSPGICA